MSVTKNDSFSQTSTTYNPGSLQTGTTYFWQIIAKDEHGASTPGPIWHFTTQYGPGNKPPGKPTMDGPTSGKPGELYEYMFVITDPDGDEICYFVDWGDDTSSGWSDFVESGIEIAYKQNWAKQGTYTVKAKAKDIYGAESDWGTLTVTMPRNRIVTNNIFQRWFERFPNLFPLLQKLLLLQRLGLQ